jgi:uncharacterized protein YndB with AHSA1/START domain
MNVDSKLRTAELVIKREFNVSRERVFAAWTDVQQASRWWLPRGFTTLACEIDLRVGGVWRRRMRSPDGAVILKHGVWREITAPERLVFTYNTEHADGSVDPETLVTLSFADLGGNRTRMTLSHTAFESDFAQADHERGWIGSIDRLAAFIAGGNQA